MENSFTLLRSRDPRKKVPELTLWHSADAVKKSSACLLILAGLICDTAAGLAGRLTGGLTLTASAINHTLLHITSL